MNLVVLEGHQKACRSTCHFSSRNARDLRAKKKVELDFDRFLVKREDHTEMKILNSEGIIIL